MGNIIKLFIIIFISLYHYKIINFLEKKIVNHFSNNSLIFRPNKLCNNKKYHIKNSIDAKCLGMPSGHAETITIFSILLYSQKYIPFWCILLFIFIIGIQRIIYERHTLLQVIMGILLGIIYSFIYIKTNISYLSIIIMISLSILYYLIIHS
jgi:membrane-associated phospholipid phosphatase